MTIARYGLKLWSTNRNYVRAARALWEKNMFDYIELFVQPGTFDTCVSQWKEMRVPYIIHAPHYMQGLNFSCAESQAGNIVLVQETLLWADALKARHIIFHPGISGDVEETARQMSRIRDARVLVENKPYCTVSNDGRICVGHSASDIALILRRTGHGFCLDIGHALCSAVARGKDIFEEIKAYLSLRPALFHFSDGDRTSPIDVHAHIGEGNYPLPALLALLPARATVTVETQKSHPRSLRDFARDVARLRRMERSIAA